MIDILQTQHSPASVSAGDAQLFDPFQVRKVGLHLSQEPSQDPHDIQATLVVVYQRRDAPEGNQTALQLQLPKADLIRVLHHLMRELDPAFENHAVPALRDIRALLERNENQ